MAKKKGPKGMIGLSFGMPTPDERIKMIARSAADTAIDAHPEVKRMREDIAKRVEREMRMKPKGNLKGRRR